jgi:hypothetical protein
MPELLQNRLVSIMPKRIAPMFKNDGASTQVAILEKALIARGSLAHEDTQARWNSALERAIEAFKRRDQLRDPGITLQVLDSLGTLDETSASLRSGH